MINTLYQKSSGKFLRKTAKLSILTGNNGKFKKSGKVKLNLVDYYDTPIREQNYPILRSKDKTAELLLSIKADFLDAELESKDEKESSDEERVNKNIISFAEIEEDLEELNEAIEKVDELKTKLANLAEENTKIMIEIENLKKTDVDLTENDDLKKLKHKNKKLKEDIEKETHEIRSLTTNKSIIEDDM